MIPIEPIAARAANPVAAAQRVGPREIAEGNVNFEGRNYKVILKSDYDRLVASNEELERMVEQLLRQNEEFDEVNRALTETITEMSAKQKDLKEQVQKINDKNSKLTKIAVVAGIAAAAAVVVPGVAAVAALI